jgi:hypothetical protein
MVSKFGFIVSAALFLSAAGAWVLEATKADAQENCEGICEHWCNWYFEPQCVEAKNAGGAWDATLTFAWCFEEVPDLGYIAWDSAHASDDNVIVEESDIVPGDFYPASGGLQCADDIQVTITNADLVNDNVNGAAVIEGFVFEYTLGSCTKDKILAVKCFTCGDCP